MSISNLTTESIRRQEPKRRDQLGWCADGFVLPHALVTPGGVEPLLGEPPPGNVQGWVNAVHEIGHARPHVAFAVLAGLGSALLPPGVNSAVVSFVGSSGTGKTTSARLALSAFGLPETLMQGGMVDVRSIEKKLTSNRHLPYLLDEVTQYNGPRLANAIFLMANGVGRWGQTWRLTPFLTSNRALLEFGNLHEAHRRRLLEIRLDDPLTISEVSKAVPAWTEHYGTAAPVFLREAMRHDTRAMFESAVRSIDLPSENRFGIWTLAAAMVAGEIATRAHLVNWNCAYVVDEVTKIVRQATRDTITEEQYVRRAIAQWMEDNRDRVNDGSGNVVNPVMRMMPRGVIAVSAAALYESLAVLRIHKALVDRALNRALVGRATVRLMLTDKKGETAILLNMQEVQTWTTNAEYAEL